MSEGLGSSPLTPFLIILKYNPHTSPPMLAQGAFALFLFSKRNSRQCSDSNDFVIEEVQSILQLLIEIY
jgi:hypothetical protein